MAKITFKSNKLKMSGTGHAKQATIDSRTITPDFLKALVDEPVGSIFYLPNIFKVLVRKDAKLLLEAFENTADAQTKGKYLIVMSRKRVTSIDKLVPVWRMEVETDRIVEVIRVRDGTAFVRMKDQELVPEFRFYRRYLMTIGDHLDKTAREYASIAKSANATLQSPIVEKKVCVHDSNNAITTITAWGPENQDPAMWVMPAGYTYIDVDEPKYTAPQKPDPKKRY